MVYYNLIIEMYAKGISQAAVSKALGISEKSLHHKLYGREAFLEHEVSYISELFPHLTIEYLFNEKNKRP